MDFNGLTFDMSGADQLAGQRPLDGRVRRHDDKHHIDRA